MKKLIIHAGLHKTGSTSIQYICKKYSNELLAQGIYYMKFDENEWENHSIPLSLLFQNNPRVSNHSVGSMFSSDEMASIYRMKIDKYLNEELIKNKADTILLSGEDLSIFSIIELIKLKNYFLSIDEFEIKIIIYVCNPLMFAISGCQELVRAGLENIETIFTMGNLQRAESKIKKLIIAFGNENVQVISLDDVLCTFTDVTKHFFEFIGCHNIDFEKNNKNEFSSIEKILTLSSCHSYGREVAIKVSEMMTDDGSKFLPEDYLSKYINMVSQDDVLYLEKYYNISFADVNNDKLQYLNYKILHENILKAYNFLKNLGVHTSPAILYNKIIRDTIIFMPKLSSMICVRAFNMYKESSNKNYIYYFKSIKVLEGFFYKDIFLLQNDERLLSNFDPVTYLTENLDVANSGTDPFEHFILFGQFEGRKGGSNAE